MSRNIRKVLVSRLGSSDEDKGMSRRETWWSGLPKKLVINLEFENFT